MVGHQAKCHERTSAHAVRSRTLYSLIVSNCFAPSPCTHLYSAQNRVLEQINSSTSVVATSSSFKGRRKSSSGREIGESCGFSGWLAAAPCSSILAHNKPRAAFHRQKCPASTSHARIHVSRSCLILCDDHDINDTGPVQACTRRYLASSKSLNPPYHNTW